MTRTWAEGFRRLEAEGLRLVDGLAQGAADLNRNGPDTGGDTGR